jgi:hypothetical protein
MRGHAAIRRLAPFISALAILAAPAQGMGQDATAPRAEARPLLDDLPALKRVQRDQLLAGARRRFADAARERREAKRAHAKARGLRARRAAGEEGPPPADLGALRAGGVLPADRAQRIGAVAPNVAISNPAGDGTSNGLPAGQAEESLAMVGQYGLCAWNDGQGFVPGSSGDVQGFGYTTDGGATWTDGGVPRRTGATGGTIAGWTSDPVVAVNEKTGEFYYTALVDGTSSNNGIAVVRATFSGAAITWDTPRVVSLVPNTSDLLDKEWLIADSTSGNLYLTYTHIFSAGGQLSDEILFRRSTDKGITWSSPIKLNDPANDGAVQASRPVVGPGGELYVTWKEIGPSISDFVKVRASIDRGVSFGVENTAATFFDNWGTGAPGFNRERGATEPCPAVDRSTGAHRGRLYVTWQESTNWYDTLVGVTGNISEIEPDGSFIRARAFTPGVILRGTYNTTTDADFYSFGATQGTTYVFFCDSVAASLYSMRVMCGADTGAFTSLAYTGAVYGSPGDHSIAVWTAPSTGTYYLRMAYLDVLGGGGSPGPYRVMTGVDPPTAGERGRDQRDVFVAYSDNRGTTWSTPSRVNADPPWLDNWLPEMAVPTDGMPYVIWYDWRDATAASCAGRSHVYVSHSADGGATWVAGAAVTSTESIWSGARSNLVPNQGDYLGLYGGDRLVIAWADTRAGDVDVWGAVLPVGPAPPPPPPPPPSLAFALERPRPNPSNGPLSIAFSLPDDAPALLTLVDMAGREAFRLEVGPMGAGAHVLPIGDFTSGLRSGRYVIRLERGGKVLTERVSLIR